MSSQDSHAHDPDSTERTSSGLSAVGTAFAVGMRYLRMTVYSLTVLLGLALLIIGANAILAELQGTWHWQIHLQSTISYMGVFIGGLVAVLVPLFGLLLVGRLLQYAYTVSTR